MKIAPPNPTSLTVRQTLAGFSMIEIMIALTIISLLAALSIPTLKSVRRRTAATAIGNDLRTFAAFFDAYVHETGSWPADTDAGVIPTEMTGRLNAVGWLRTTPMGGQYNWDNNQMHAGTRFRAAIAITGTDTAPFVQDLDLFEAVDRIIDDGILTTGNFRIGADDEPVFIIAP
jgi:prepilin-type N-terminal cleavage/methylation domain-containing protein